MVDVDAAYEPNEKGGMEREGGGGGLEKGNKKVRKLVQDNREFAGGKLTS